jgi:hypothetical protein
MSPPEEDTFVSHMLQVVENIPAGKNLTDYVAGYVKPAPRKRGGQL